MPLGEKTPEVDPIIKNLSRYKSYKELPLVSTGCDSYAAVYPEFKNLSPMLTVNAIAEQIVNLLPHKEWRDEHLVITGGEPLLGWQKQYPDLLAHPLMAGLTEITFETNGTQLISDAFWDYLEEWKKEYRREITFSVSAKLPGSGEQWEEAIKPRLVVEYEQLGYTYLKFVVANDQDVAYAEQAVAEYRAAGFVGPVYLMPVGGVNEVYNLNNKTVAELALKKGWRYSDRLQLPLFKNAWGT
jgi:organic radical activating enzyme